MRFYEIPLSEVERLIMEWIPNKTYREILRDRLIDGTPYKELADRYNLTERRIKTIVAEGSERIFAHTKTWTF